MIENYDTYFLLFFINNVIVKGPKCAKNNKKEKPLYSSETPHTAKYITVFKMKKMYPA